MDPVSAAAKMTLSPVTATALPQRTEGDVIADLQRARRPAHIARVQNWQESSSTLLPEDVLPDPFKPLPLVEDSHLNIKSAPDIEEYATQYDDDDSDVEDQSSSKQRVMSERKRRQYAIANNHLQEKLRNPTTEHSNQVKSGEETTKTIVKQSRNEKIIDSPREYQNELFERAKEKNIIAVLDTGL